MLLFVVCVRCAVLHGAENTSRVSEWLRPAYARVWKGSKRVHARRAACKEEGAAAVQGKQHYATFTACML